MIESHIDIRLRSEMRANALIHMAELLMPTETEEIDASQASHEPLTAPPRPKPLPLARLVFLFTAASLLLHFLGRERYGFFRDELYYIACGNHVAFGYVDQPPLIAVIARLSSLVFGNTISGFRFFPALASAGLVLLTGWMTREFGGGRFAQTLASFAVLLAPIYLAFGSFLSMNVFEPLFWVICACILVRILKGGDQRLWLLFGAVAGAGLQNKHTMLMFGFAVIAGMTLAGDGKYMRTKWFWLGGLLALVIFLPNLVWEAQHNWPQIEVVHNARTIKNNPVSWMSYLGEQILFLNPVALPIVGAGLAWLFLSKKEQRFRALGWAFLIVLVVVKVLQGKAYYPMPFYPILLAAGGVAFGSLPLDWRKCLRPGFLGLLAISGLLMLPFGVPVLPLETLLRYQKLISLENAVQVEHDSAGELDQLYADMFGWDSMTATIANVYHGLSVTDQAQCAILAGNYGEAGAIDLLGTKYGLPRAISGHNNYYFWGPQGHTGEVVILFGQNAESIKTMFGSVERVAIISDAHAVAAENHLPVYICRRPKAPLTQIWPSLRYFE